jgi:D-alanine-D-alanine ligase-like ATP-grasp enzyme
VLEDGNTMRAFNPSITVAEGEVLSVEEKFQGGTGVNITPPPPSIMRRAALMKVRKNIARLAELVGIQGYSRIDAFVNALSGDLMIIEINTLPGLTPSTVFYQQALAEKPPLFPRTLLEHIVRHSH